jgi:hypothetical protein
MLHRVRQQLGDDVVAGGLDWFGEPLRHGHVEVDRDGAATRERA